MKLFLDDFRMPTECASYMYLRNVHCGIYHEDWVIVRSYEQFVYAVKEHIGNIEIVSFDYDLADNMQLREELQTFEWFDFDNNREYNGLDCAKFMLQYYTHNNINLPRCVIHSSNPDGTDELKLKLNIT